MSRIHTALKASSKKGNSSPAPKKEQMSALDEKLISAGVSREILAEAHNDRVKNSGGFFDHLIRKTQDCSSHHLSGSGYRGKRSFQLPSCRSFTANSEKSESACRPFPTGRNHGGNKYGLRYEPRFSQRLF